MKKPNIYYCIRNKRGEYWDNDWGWIVLGDKQDDTPFSIFTLQEKSIFNLPIEGRWAKLDKNYTVKSKHKAKK